MHDHAPPPGFGPFGSPPNEGEERGQKTSVIVRPEFKTAPDRPAGEAFSPTPERIAGSLGHFKVLETLGRGGFGVVVKAFDLKLQRLVAIKMMSSEMAATSPARKRFVREARAGAAVRHENVVRIYAVEEEPLPYLVMEYVPGGSLQQFLDRTGPLDPREVVRIGAQIARGLAAAHATGLVHRDIKPANVMLESGEHAQVKLTDFGLARAADDASLSQSGTVVGTPMYMSPEQARGEAFDHRADLYSLGSVMYVMVSGRPPFRAPNSLAVLARVAVETPRPIRDIIPETPRWLCDIISRLHAQKPDDRFADATEVAEILERCLAELRSGAPVMPVPFAAPARPRPQPRRWRQWVAAGALACAAIVSAVVALRPSKPQGTVAEPPAAPAPAPAAKAPATAPARPAAHFTNALGIEFMKVPAGEGLMGDPNAPDRRKVTFPDDFFIGRYEVTRAEWESLMGAGSAHSLYSRTGALKGQVADVSDDDLRRFPVDNVSWNQAQEFIKRLNAKVTETGWVYRLPTSAEWEYACRNGPGQATDGERCEFYAGDPKATLAPHLANFKDTGLNRPCPVGSFPPNRLGVHDLHGNVFEWLDDLGPVGSDRHAVAGGWWADEAHQARASIRSRSLADSQPAGSGLRLARVPASRAVTERMRYESVAADLGRELRKVNPEFKGTLCPELTGDRVTGLEALNVHELADISPLAKLTHLERFEAWRVRIADLSPLRNLPLRELSINNNDALRDLAPLAGLKLEGLQIWGFQGGDLSPLKGMPLRSLNCGGGGQKLDLSPLKGAPLGYLCVNLTQVSDLSPLKGMPLDELLIEHTQVKDLSPLKGMKLRKLLTRGLPTADLSVVRDMPLEIVTLDYDPARHRELLRSLPNLKEVNDKPVAEFWKEVEKK